MKAFLSVLMLIFTCLPGMAQQSATPWMGAAVVDLTEAEVSGLGWSAPHGVRVTSIVAGSPAELAGLKQGDILVSLDGAEIADSQDFVNTIVENTVGAKVAVAMRRGGAEQQLSVTLGARPVQHADSNPQLMLDPGGHMAAVADVAITPDGKQVVSASNDKTVRVWDVATGKTVRVIFGEAAPGDWGMLYAMALSPDGRWLATAGYLSDDDPVSGGAIRLYDFASGNLVKLIKGHKNVVTRLAFSPDSKRLISGSMDRTAIVWDVSTGRRLVLLKGHTDAVKTVAFSGDGARVLTGSDDQTARLWNAADGKLIAEMLEHKLLPERERQGKVKWLGKVVSAKFSPDDRVIATGSSDGRVLFWDGATGAFLREFAYPGGWGNLTAIGSISFSSDGKWLLFTSQSEGCSIMEIASGKEIKDGKLQEIKRDFMDTGNNIRCTGGMGISPDGAYAVASYNSLIRIFDPRTGYEIKTLQSSGSTVFAAGFARDGSAIAWGTDLPKTSELAPLMYRFGLPRDGLGLTAPERIGPAPVADQKPAKIGGDHPRLSDGLAPTPQPAPDDGAYLRRNNKNGPKTVDFKKIDKFTMNASKVEISNNDQLQTQIEVQGDPGRHAFLAFTPDGQTILLGRSPTIDTYDLAGRSLTSFIGHLGSVRDLAASSDGRYLVSGSSDQTVRLWNLQTRELIVSLFYGMDGEWVVWTPQGYYTSSPNGDRIVGWQINKGPDQAAEYVTANQLRHKFYRPDIVERAIILASAKKAVEEAGPDSAGGFRLSDLAQRLPPKLGVLSPRDGSETASGRTTVELALAEAAGDPVNRFDVFVNDTKVTAAARRESGTVSFELPLAEGSNIIRVVARSAGDLLGEARLGVVQRGEGALDKRNTLFILAIGSDKYPQLPRSCGAAGNAPCDLAFAGADARSFAETVEKQMGRQHLRVVKKVLVNGAGGDLEPTRANVENAFDMLLQSKDNDTVAVFIAGHGVNDARSGYQYLPSDARFADGSALASSTVVKWAAIEGAIQSAKGRRLLFVDTCRSTNAFNPRLMKDANDDAIVAFSATNTQQDALELPSLGHGVFTNAVVKGLSGAADIAQEQEVRVFDLGAYVEREVRKLTKGRQTPDFYKKPGAENFVLVRMGNETAALPLPAPPAGIADVKPSRQENRPAKPTQTALAAAPEKPAEAKPSPETQGDLKPPRQDARPAQPSQTALAPAAEKPADAKPAILETKPPALTISANEEAERLKRGQAALALDDIAGARLIFEYLANHGSAAGAYQLALTYDPQVQASGPLGSSFQPDEKLAQSWYAKAAELGHPEARKKIATKK